MEKGEFDTLIRDDACHMALPVNTRFLNVIVSHDSLCCGASISLHRIQHVHPLASTLLHLVRDAMFHADMHAYISSN
jgi:hypothetical protein